MKLFRVRIAQQSNCAKCGISLSERKRKPCPRCGSLARIFNRTVTENLGAGDRSA